MSIFSNEPPSVSLRALESADIEATLAWHNSGELYQNLGAPARFVSRESEIQWLKARSAFSQNELNLAIITAGDGKHIGNIYLREIDWVSRRGVLHIFIGDSVSRSKGYGTAAVNLLIEHAFLNLNLQRITLEVLEDNEHAVACYAKLGFVKEGVLRKHIFKNGNYLDVFYMAILKEEFLVWKSNKGDGVPSA